MNRTALIAVSAANVGVAGLSSLPGLYAFLAQLRERKPKDNFYEDVDGKSTPEAVAAFSQRVPKTVIGLTSTVGLGLSIAISVLSTLDTSDHGSHQHASLLENWLSTASWALILAQAIFLTFQHAPVTSYELGLWAAGSSFVTAASTALQAVSVFRAGIVASDPSFILRIINFATAILLIFASMSIRRRPNVYLQGKQVSDQMTSHAIHRFTWGWVNPLIDTACRNGDLDEKDIPGADHTLRAEALVQSWNSNNFKGTLLSSLLWAYRYNLIGQMSLTLVRAFFGLAPFWLLLRIIKTLELIGEDKSSAPELWLFVVALASCKFIEQWLDNFTWWVALSGLAYPMRGQLSTLIFSKALRRKNVKMADPNEVKPEDSSEENQDNAKDKDKKDKDKPKEDDTVLKSRQAIVNLVGVDSRRIAGFLGIFWLFPNSLGKLLFFSGFLIQLIGWIPFVVGFGAWALILPLNTYASRRYMKASEDLMKARDNKLAIVNEALMGMRQIKFSALEKEWEKRILAMREKEIKTIVRVFINDTMIFGCWIISPILLAAASLTTYALINGGLSPSTAFVSISVFRSLELTLGGLPELFTMGFDTLVSIRRVDKYLTGPEMKQIVTEGSDISFDNASVAWPVDDEETPEEDRFVLRNINLNFPRGELSVISGKTGTGKSLLLSALLGEVDLLEGSIQMPPTTPPLDRNDAGAHPGNWILKGSVAYVPQTPWLESTSLRDNILFGLPYDEERFNKILDACALRKDIESLVDGDQTKLGANGINLSGGQKWRVTLARAIYSRAEILVMDDIFSAVDAHVGRQIYENCVVGELCSGRTRILVTHHVALVQPKTKFLVELGDGTVIESGLTSELAEDGTLDRIKSHGQSQAEIEAEESITAQGTTAVNSEQNSIAEGSESPAKPTEEDPKKGDPKKEGKDFIQKEGKEKGMVKSRVYKIYLSVSGGWVFWIVCLCIFIMSTISDLGRSWWLKIWTGSNQQAEGSVNAHSLHGYAYGFTLQHPMHAAQGPIKSGDVEHNLRYYLLVYVGIAMLGGTFGTLRFMWSFIMSLRASRALFKSILFAVLRTPLRWLDTVPVGRILNRLTSDFDIIDSSITLTLAMFFWQIFNVIGVCIASAIVSPYTLILAAVLMCLAALLGRRYLSPVRPLKRLESNAKSPVFEIFNAALSGVASLRAYQKTDVYVDRMYDHMDYWNSTSCHMWIMSAWMSVRMAIIGSMFTSCVGIFIVGSPLVDASLAGFAMSFAVDFASNILFGIRHYANLEMNMNAAERVIEYSELKTEKLDGTVPAASWPTTGNMEVQNLDVAYADDLPLVLKNLSFKIANNERIGVVGRTGAGKSSLTLALFRFLEPRAGKVLIDGLDISQMDLHSLRSRLAIIPQDPVLFSGTVRSNLDPFDNHTDAALRDCLARVHLTDSTTGTPANEPASAAVSTLAPQNTNIFKSLSSGISESGGNLSQGQRQLLCLARAIVSRPKIMVLDEATSAVDMNTDALIQRSIREEFTDSTLIVIAHRLSTIADFDKILVLSDGQVEEFGSPKELWETEGSLFRDMCEKSGEKDKLEKTILGQE